MQIAGRVTVRSLTFITAYEVAVAILANGAGLGTGWCMAILWHLPIALALLIRNRAAVALWCAGTHLSIFAGLLSGLQAGLPGSPTLFFGR
jgi:hypothetical protein